MSEGMEHALLGFGGGLAAELVQWFGLRFTLYREIPDWSKSWFYWVITILMALAGGGLACIYFLSGTKLTPILALNIGASAPLLLGKLVQQAPTGEPGKAS